MQLNKIIISVLRCSCLISITYLGFLRILIITHRWTQLIVVVIVVMTQLFIMTKLTQKQTYRLLLALIFITLLIFFSHVHLTNLISYPLHNVSMKSPSRHQEVNDATTTSNIHSTYIILFQVRILCLILTQHEHHETLVNENRSKTTGAELD